jgi:microcystin-dependent protein
MDAFIGTVLAVGFNYPPRGWVFCNGQTLLVSQYTALFALVSNQYGGDGRTTFGVPDLRGRVIVGSQAQGPGLVNIPLASKDGSNTATVNATGTASVALAVANLPPHTHAATFVPAGLAVDTSALKVTTAITVGTDTTNGLAQVVANNGGLTSTATGQPSAAIYLPANTGPAGPVTLGGVTSTVSGTAAVGGNATVNNAMTGTGAILAAPVVTSATVNNMQPYLGLNYIICVEGIYPSRN